MPAEPLLVAWTDLQALAEDQGRQLAVVADVSAAFARDESLPTKLQRIAGALCERLGAAFARIWTVSGDGTMLELQASAGMYNHLDGGHSRVPVGQFKIGRIAQDRLPHLTNQVIGDLQVHDQDWARREGMVAFAGYPLVAGHRLIGVMALFARHRLGDGVLGALAAVADQLAVGIDQAWLLRRSQRQSEQLRGLADAALAMTANLDLDAVLAVVVDRARALVGAHQAVISLTTGGSWAQTIDALSFSTKYAAYRDYDMRSDGSGIYAMVCETNRPVRMTQAELETHPQWRGLGAHAAEHPPMRGWLAVPLVRSDGRNLGLLQLSDRFADDFTADDESVLVQLAQAASAAIESAQLYRERDEIAAALERGLLPVPVPAIPGIQIATRYAAMGQGLRAGGDFIDVFEVGAGRWAVLVGDVSGKGPEAAAVTGLARHVAWAAATDQPTPGHVLTSIHAGLLRHRTERFCTALCGIFESRAAIVSFDGACAGHELPLVISTDGTVTPALAPGQPLGLFEVPQLGFGQLELRPGELLVLYTDGLVDPRGHPDDHDEGALRAILGGLAGSDPDLVADTLMSWAVAINGVPDDIAIVVMQADNE